MTQRSYRAPSGSAVRAPLPLEESWAERCASSLKSSSNGDLPKVFARWLIASSHLLKMYCAPARFFALPGLMMKVDLSRRVVSLSGSYNETKVLQISRTSHHSLGSSTQKTHQHRPNHMYMDHKLCHQNTSTPRYASRTLRVWLKSCYDSVVICCNWS